jgi:proteasome lid subunit RPN8/RPN11
MVRPPIIVGEHKREIRVQRHPPTDRIIYPKSRPAKHYEFWIKKPTMDKIMKHCKEYAEERLEVMGFLIGDLYEWEDIQYTLTKDIVTTDLEATSVSVKFARDGFEGLFEKMDDIQYDYILTGWYHSHPGLGCFLSETDVDTQRRMFNQPFHTAMVVDPIKRDVRAYKLKDDGYMERKMAVYKPASMEEK